MWCPCCSHTVHSFCIRALATKPARQPRISATRRRGLGSGIWKVPAKEEKLSCQPPKSLSRMHACTCHAPHVSPPRTRWHHRPAAHLGFEAERVEMTARLLKGHKAGARPPVVRAAAQPVLPTSPPALVAVDPVGLLRDVRRLTAAPAPDASHHAHTAHAEVMAQRSARSVRILGVDDRCCHCRRGPSRTRRFLELEGHYEHRPSARRRCVTTLCLKPAPQRASWRRTFCKCTSARKTFCGHLHVWHGGKFVPLPTELRLFSLNLPTV